MGGWDTQKTTLLHHNGSVSSSFNLAVRCEGCCGIEDHYSKSLILSGGYYTVCSHSSSYCYNYRTNVVRYNENGFLEHLPHLRKGVYYHGCSMYYNNNRLPVSFCFNRIHPFQYQCVSF